MRISALLAFSICMHYQHLLSQRPEENIIFFNYEPSYQVECEFFEVLIKQLPQHQKRYSSIVQNISHTFDYSLCVGRFFPKFEISQRLIRFENYESFRFAIKALKIHFNNR